MAATLDQGLGVLQRSAAHLRDIVAPLDDRGLAVSAYPSEWRVADVCSHIGSSAVIMQRRLDDAARGTSTPDEFPASVWDIWNAKSARAKADDALVADRAFVERATELSHGDWSTLEIVMGPLHFGLPSFVATRCNEHVLHTWDIDVAFNPNATLPPDAAVLIVDNLELIARYTARPIGTQRTVIVRTTNPARDFTIELEPDTVTFMPAASTPSAELTIPAEAFIRLVYGRLDTDVTPARLTGSDLVEQLRHVFPGP